MSGTKLPEFTEKELMLLLEGLYAIQEQRKHVLELANTHLLAMERVELEPEDFGLPTIERLIERFAAAAPPGLKLVTKPEREGNDAIPT